MGNLSIIAAIGQHYEIGKDNDLLWNIPTDMKRFMKMTSGHTVIMGYRTFESLKIKPLPKRRNVVLTSKNDIGYPSVEIAHSVQEILKKIKGEEKEVFVIGGASVYELLLPYCSCMYLTFVQASYEADTFFPEFKLSDWKETYREDITDDELAGVNYSFVNFIRI